MSPLLIAVGLVGGAVLVATLARRARLAASPGARAPVWGCGGTRLSPRMEYTATSFAEPLMRVFDDVLRPEHDVDVTHYAGVALPRRERATTVSGCPTGSRPGSTRR